MKLSWRTCFRAGLTALLIILAARYWSGAMTVLEMFIAAASPLLIGAVIAYIVNILMAFYERHVAPKSTAKLWQRLRRPVCMTLAFLSVVLAVYLIFALIIPQLFSAFEVLLSSLPKALDALYTWADEHLALGAMLDDFDPSGLENNWRTLLEKASQLLFSGVSGVMNAAVSVTTSLVGGVVTFFLALIFAANILLSKEKLHGQFLRLLRCLLPEKPLRHSMHLLSTLNSCFHNYIVGQCIEAVILGGLCALGMLVLRLPYAVMISALIGVTALIPIAGAYIGAAVGAVMIFSVSPVQALIFIVFLVILQQIEGNLIYPHTVGSTLELPGLWVLAAVLIGGGMMGVLGMMIFVPLTAAAYRLLGEWLRSREKALP